MAIGRARPVAIACDSSFEGVLAGVGVTYLAHARPGQVRLARAASLQPQLGEEVIRLPHDTDDDTVAFSERVLTGFMAHVRREGAPMRTGHGKPSHWDGCMRRLVYATASDEERMPEVVHQYLRLGFSVGPRVCEMITDERVAALDDLARYVLNECEHTRQFVRFSHMADGSYLASFSPAANTIPLVAPYFSARMGPERFCLVDPRHRVAAFHEAGARGCTLVRLDAQLASALANQHDLADDEAYVRVMWQRFYRDTTTPGRDRAQRGYDLRMHWMPRRLWDGLLELDEPTPHNLVIPARYQGGEGLLEPVRSSSAKPHHR